MAIPENIKVKSMDAVSHRETATLMRSMKAAPVARHAPGQPSVSAAVGVKQYALAATQVVTQAGWITAAAGVAAYVGKIREADREMHTRQLQRGPRTVHQNGLERLE